MLYLLENEEYGHVLSDNLPLDLDNRLYTIIHVIGGISFHDIVKFANNATPEEIQHLYEKVYSFPSTMESLLPYAGGFHLLKDSDEYKEIKDIIDFKWNKDTLLQEQSQPNWDPAFNEIISPDLKEKLFNYWTKLGEADWDAFKLFGLVQTYVDNPEGYFDEIVDIVYPVLRIEWEGGIDKTVLGLKKDEWRHADVDGIFNIRYKVIPTSYTYNWDKDEYTEGHACWNLTYVIDKESVWTLDGIVTGIEGKSKPITDIFPDKVTYDIRKSLEDGHLEVVDELWQWIANEGRAYFNEYCNVTVKIV